MCVFSRVDAGAHGTGSAAQKQGKGILGGLFGGDKKGKKDTADVEDAIEGESRSERVGLCGGRAHACEALADVFISMTPCSRPSSFSPFLLLFLFSIFFPHQCDSCSVPLFCSRSYCAQSVSTSYAISLSISSARARSLSLSRPHPPLLRSLSRARSLFVCLSLARSLYLFPSLSLSTFALVCRSPSSP
jgi:hypothetical protein